MNKESNPSSNSTNSTDESHPLSIPIFFSSSSSSLKPLRERNRTNLKRRINLSRSQVLSNDFENGDNLPRTNSTNKSVSTTNNSQSTLLPPSQQQPSTPTIHTHTELYSKTVSPKTPSPIHTTVTCSQVWERLASNEEYQITVSQKSNTSSSSSTASNIPTHIYFTYDPDENNDKNNGDNDNNNKNQKDDDEEDDDDELPSNDKNDFQYVPVSSQSKLVQFQFLTFARQQLVFNEENTSQKKKDYDSDDDDDDEDDEDEDNENTLIDYGMEEGEQEDEGQENRASKKRKRSVSTTDSLDGIPPFSDRTTNDTTATGEGASASVTKPPRNKKPKIKDPNANFQRLNMRKKNFSHAKKHQFSKHKRNAFYRRMRNAGGK